MAKSIKRTWVRIPVYWVACVDYIDDWKMIRKYLKVAKPKTNKNPINFECLLFCCICSGGSWHFHVRGSRHHGLRSLVDSSSFGKTSGSKIISKSSWSKKIIFAFQNDVKSSTKHSSKSFKSKKKFFFCISKSSKIIIKTYNQNYSEVKNL